MIDLVQAQMMFERRFLDKFRIKHQKLRVTSNGEETNGLNTIADHSFNYSQR